jgi:MarR family transcriptional regulator, organic hydroperoxide resistance regulator
MKVSPELGGMRMDDQGRRVMEKLRAYAADYTELTHHLAKWLGVHSADAAAFAEILYAEDKGAPLTPARLARRITLTSGATSSLLNRLEAAELLIRTREAADRRVVTLRSVPAVSAQAGDFFAPLAERVDELMGQTPPGVLAEFELFLTRLHDIMVFVSANIDQLVQPRVSGD